MLDDVAVFKMANALAGHAASRQTLAAENVANADTPGFQARDLPAFAAQFSQGSALSARTTRAGHIDGSVATRKAEPTEVAGERAPNGNSVSLETEMFRAAEIRHQHDVAMAVYRAALGIMRSAVSSPR